MKLSPRASEFVNYEGLCCKLVTQKGSKMPNDASPVSLTKAEEVIAEIQSPIEELLENSSNLSVEDTKIFLMVMKVHIERTLKKSLHELKAISGSE